LYNTIIYIYIIIKVIFYYSPVYNYVFTLILAICSRNM